MKDKTERSIAVTLRSMKAAMEVLNEKLVSTLEAPHGWHSEGRYWRSAPSLQFSDPTGTSVEWPLLAAQS